VGIVAVKYMVPLCSQWLVRDASERHRSDRYCNNLAFNFLTLTPHYFLYFSPLPFLVICCFQYWTSPVTLYYYLCAIFFYLAAFFELENVATVQARSQGVSAVMNLES
jgi:hypothetical protein